jgi:hypothetical protein
MEREAKITPRDKPTDAATVAAAPAAINTPAPLCTDARPRRADRPFGGARAKPRAAI